MLSGPASLPRCSCYDYQGSLPAPFVRVCVWDRHFLHRILWQLLLCWEGFNRWDFSFKVKAKLSLCTPFRQMAGVQVSSTVLIIIIIRWRLLVSLVHCPLCRKERCPQYILHRRLGGLQESVWMCRRREKISYPCWELNLDSMVIHSMYGATARSGPWPPSKRASTHPCFQLFSSILLLLTAVMHPSEPRLPIWFLVFPLVLCCGRYRKIITNLYCSWTGRRKLVSKVRQKFETDTRKKFWTHFLPE